MAEASSLARPAIKSISPGSHESGSFDVVISGSNFMNVQKIDVYSTINSSVAVSASFKVNSSTQITATLTLEPGSYYFRVKGFNLSSNRSPKLLVTFPITTKPSSGLTSYRLKSPLPAIVNDGTVSEGVSTASSRCMWKDGNNVVHLFAAFGDAHRKLLLPLYKHRHWSQRHDYRRLWRCQDVCLHPSANKLYICREISWDLGRIRPGCKSL